MTDFFVSPSGADTSTGSITSPFLTVIHGLRRAKAGDRLILREGVYRDNSGWFAGSATETNPISLEAYAGEKAVLTALTLVSGWEPFDLAEGKAIYRAPMPFTMCGSSSAPAGEDFITVNKIPLNEAQWPVANPNDYPQKSATWASVEKGVWIGNSDAKEGVLATLEIQDADLNSFPEGSLVGSRITLVPGARWTSVSGTVLANTGNKLTCKIKSPGADSFYAPDSRSIYFLFGKNIFLNTPGSWWRDPETNYLYLWLLDGSDPNFSVVEAKKDNKVLDFWARSHYRFKNLNFVGGFVNIHNASNIHFDGCTFIWYAHRLYRERAWGWVNPALYINKDFVKIRGCNFLDACGPCIVPESQRGLTIENCVISNTVEFGFTGTDSKFLRNTVVDSPGGCFKLMGNVVGTEIGYNTFGRAGTTFTDGGIFLIAKKCFGEGRIHHNFLHDGCALSDGTKQFYGTAGIYFEPDVSNLVFDRNIICRTTSPGISLVANSAGRKIENVVFSNNTCDGSLFWIPPSAGNPKYPNVQFNNNYFARQERNTGYHSDLQFFGNAFGVLPKFLENSTNIEVSNLDFDSNYSLRPDSAPHKASQVVGSASTSTSQLPKIGAREGVNPWTAGAFLRDIDIPSISIASYSIEGDRIIFDLSGIPSGRHLGDNFEIKLGSGSAAIGTIAHYSVEFGQTVWARVDSSEWRAIGQIDPPPPPVLKPSKSKKKKAPKKSVKTKK